MQCCDTAGILARLPASAPCSPVGRGVTTRTTWPASMVSIASGSLTPFASSSSVRRAAIRKTSPVTTSNLLGSSATQPIAWPTYTIPAIWRAGHATRMWAKASGPIWASCRGWTTGRPWVVSSVTGGATPRTGTTGSAPGEKLSVRKTTPGSC